MYLKLLSTYLKLLCYLTLPGTYL